MNYKIYQLSGESFGFIHEGDFADDSAALDYAAGLDPSRVYQIEAVEATCVRLVTSTTSIPAPLDEVESRCAALNARRDEMTGRSPLVVEGIGPFDYSPLSREKILGAQRYLEAVDVLDPSRAHSMSFTLFDNSQVELDLNAFRLLNIASAVRGYVLHQACLRAKGAVRGGGEPDSADLAILGL